jgi:hypothetical protein
MAKWLLNHLFTSFLLVTFADIPKKKPNSPEVHPSAARPSYRKTRGFPPSSHEEVELYRVSQFNQVSKNVEFVNLKIVL